MWITPLIIQLIGKNENENMLISHFNLMDNFKLMWIKY